MSGWLVGSAACLALAVTLVRLRLSRDALQFERMLVIEERAGREAAEATLMGVDFELRLRGCGTLVSVLAAVSRLDAFYATPLAPQRNEARSESELPR